MLLGYLKSNIHKASHDEDQTRRLKAIMRITGPSAEMKGGEVRVSVMKIEVEQMC